ncbi:MAG: hypothetical protein JW881_20275 [Spirochaetales bacterium]|nr:hypothetical protein [Spirochaetales bacterium]
MGFFKKFFSGFFKVLLVIIIIVVVLAGGLTLYYFLTKEDPVAYIPDNFLFYVKVNSIRYIYDNVIDLKAADVVFSSSRDLKSIYKMIIDFKSNEMSKNEFFRFLLDVRADIMIAPDYSPVIVFNPGLLSLATRMFPILNFFFKFEGVNLNQIQKGRLTIYDYPVDENQHLYFSLRNNLIFLSTKEKHIDAIYESKKTGKNLASNKEIMELRKKVKGGGFAEIYVDTGSLLDIVKAGSEELSRVFSEISFNSYSAFTFKISNEDLFLSAYTDISVENPDLRDFLSYNPSSLQVIQYLPEKTTVYTSANVKSFKQLIGILLDFKEGSQGKTLKTINDSSKLLLGATIDEILFDWMGTEMGAFTMSYSPDPVLFIRFKNRASIDAALDRISKTLFFENDPSLVLDEVRVSRIKFPDFIKGIIGLFVKGVETPYYIIMRDYIFFSMNAENLSHITNDYRSSYTLLRNEGYKKVTYEIPKNANIFMYYDLGTSMPDFFMQNNVLTSLLKLYEKGVFAIHFDEREVRIQISAAGIAGEKAVLFPGYPKPVPEGVASNVCCADVRGSRLDELIYIDNGNNLVIQDLIEETAFKAPVERDSDILVPEGEKNAVYVFSQSGTLYKFDGNGEAIPPFPVITNYKASFQPVEYNDNLVFFSDTENALYFLSPEGVETRWGFQFEAPLLSPPVFFKQMVCFYPKNFSGTVYLTDKDGTALEGWPRKGGGISFCSPLLFTDRKGEVRIAFLTQSGILNLWDIKGGRIEGFPLDLDGVFYTGPVLVAQGILSTIPFEREKALLLLDADGNMTMVSLSGEILKQKKIFEGGDKKNALLLFDVDRDDIEEIFIYGSKNFIIGLGRNLEPLPGFPVRGSKRPSFTDLNYDRTYEMIVGSFDNNIYAYTINK